MLKVTNIDFFTQKSSLQTYPIAWACYRNAAIAGINEGLDGGSQESIIVKIFAL